MRRDFGREIERVVGESVVGAGTTYIDFEDFGVGGSEEKEKGRKKEKGESMTHCCFSMKTLHCRKEDLTY